MYSAQPTSSSTTHVSASAAIRSETALKIGRALAVHRRLVQESENGLWEAIADAGGAEWRRLLEQALAVDGEDVRASAAGAVQLFALLVAECRERLDERERKIVDAALQSAEERQLLEAPR